MLFGVTPEVGERLIMLYKENDGHLAPAVVVEDAVSPDSPLNPLFTWDDKVAGHQHRLQQARQLIHRAKVHIIKGEESPPIKVRAFVAAQTANGEYGDGYVATEDVAKDEADVAAVLASIQRDLDRLKKKYLGFEELFLTALQDQLEQ